VSRASGGILWAAVFAGLVAATVASGFHLLFAEPLIERALRVEETGNASHVAAVAAPLVSRPIQRGGLVVGLLVYGVIWGALLGVVHSVLGRRRGPWEAARPGWLPALAIGWSVALFPFLKYPANPPGVGEAATIGYRQLLYGTFIVLSVAGTALAVVVHRRLQRAQDTAHDPRGWLIAAAVYVAYAAMLYVAMPASSDAVGGPADLIWTFRAISLAGLVLFWVVLGGAFGWLARAHNRYDA